VNDLIETRETPDGTHVSNIYFMVLGDSGHNEGRGLKFIVPPLRDGSMFDVRETPGDDRHRVCLDHQCRCDLAGGHLHRLEVVIGDVEGCHRGTGSLEWHLRAQTARKTVAVRAKKQS
jgi:hypothetical protein